MSKYTIQRALREENDWLRKQHQNMQALLIDVFKVAHGLTDEEAAQLRVAPIEAIDPYDPTAGDRLKRWWQDMLHDYEKRTMPTSVHCPHCDEYFTPVME